MITMTCDCCGDKLRYAFMISDKHLCEDCDKRYQSGLFYVVPKPNNGAWLVCFEYEAKCECHDEFRAPEMAEQIRDLLNSKLGD